MPGIQQAKVWQFTGSTITPHGINKGGGIPVSRQGAFYHVAANSLGIVGFVSGATYVGNGNLGQVVFMNDQDGWHHLADSTGASMSAAATIYGGGVGPGLLLTVLSDGTAWEQDLFESTELPQYATTARSYDTTALRHITAKTDVGTPTLKKVGLYTEINAKIPTGATIKVLYRADNSDGLFTIVPFSPNDPPAKFRSA